MPFINRYGGFWAWPAQPVFFTKATTAVTGPGSVMVDPQLTSRWDWEVELAVVLGSGGPGVVATPHLAALTAETLREQGSAMVAEVRPVPHR